MGTRQQTHVEAHVNHHHRKILHSFFAHPVSTNIDFKDVGHVMTALGAEADAKNGNKIEVSLNGQKAAFHRNNHTLAKAEVLHIRKFLESCGVSPESYPV
jgi:hypothetical protein